MKQLNFESLLNIGAKKLKSKHLKTFFIILFGISIMFFQTGCKKKRKQRSRAPKAKLSESIKNITLEELLPKSNIVTGRYKHNVSDKIANDYMYGTLAGQYGKIDTAEEYLIKVLKAEPLFIDAHHNLGLVYYKQGRID